MKTYGAIYSYGRSGSTWLGAIINAHPETAYRFEPWVRLGLYKQLRTLLNSNNEDHADQAKLIAEKFSKQLGLADPLVDKPPFFSKSYSRNFGRLPLWALSRFSNTTQLFKYCFSAESASHLIYKEVNAVSSLKLMLDSYDQFRASYLIRHPCGTCKSLVTGQQNEAMPMWHVENIDSVLSKQSPDLYRKYKDYFSEFDSLEKNALLWRSEVEQMDKWNQKYQNLNFVVYEDLCHRPLQVSHNVLEHLGIPWHQNIELFIKKCINSDIEKTKRSRFTFTLSEDYFNVYRNPTNACDNWKSSLSVEQQGKVLKLVEPSPVFQKYYG